MKPFFLKFGFLCFIASIFLACEDDLKEERSFLDLRPAGVGGVPEVNPFWDWIQNYPSPLSHKLQRLGKDTVHYFVNGDYELDIFYSRDNGDTLKSPHPWFGPGLYAGIMEPVTVEVPQGVGNLRCLIGSNPHFLGFGYNNRNPKPRWADVQDTIYLKPGKNVFESYFGGMVYFTWDPDTEPVKPGVDVVISGGCVRANNYVAGKTDYEKWHQSILANYIKDTVGIDDAGNLVVLDRKSDALEWVDMVGEYAIVSCRYDEFKDSENPAACLQTIDNWIRGYCEFYGFPLVQKNGKLLPQRRIISDIAGPGQGPGNTRSFYCIPIQWYYRGQYLSKGIWDYDFMTLSASRNRLITEILMYPDRTRSQGICNAFPGEFFKYFLAARFYNKLPVGAYDLPYLASDENPCRHWPKRFQDKGTPVACLISLVNEFDWGLIPYTIHAARSTSYSRNRGSGDPVERFMMHACEYANMNLEGFWDNWGWDMSTVAREYMKTFPDPPEKFWLRYRDRIAGFNPVMPPVKSTLSRQGPRASQFGTNEKKQWKVTSGFSPLDARKAADGNWRTYMVGGNVKQEDAWVRIDFNDTLYFNQMGFNQCVNTGAQVHTVRIKIGNYVDDAKTQINWEYVRNNDGEIYDIGLALVGGWGTVVNLPKMYRAEMMLVEFTKLGYNRESNRNNVRPWPGNCGISEISPIRYEYNSPHLDWPYPYVPPVKD